MPDKTPYSRTEESNFREQTMRKDLAPYVLKNLGNIVLNHKVGGMQLITVQSSSNPPFIVWVKCAWKPGSSGNCAVQMAFPSKEDRAHTADDVVQVVIDKTQRAKDRGATHLLLLAADDEGNVPLSAYLLPIDKTGEVIRESVAKDESLTKNGSSPSIYITAKGERQLPLVEIVRKYSIDLLSLTERQNLHADAIEDLNELPIGAVEPEKKYRYTPSYARDPRIRTYVINRAKGCCEYCSEKGFLMADDKSHYLETHHIIALADEGHDTLENVIALCPKHHREAHFGANKKQLEVKMIDLLKNGRRKNEQ